MSTRGTQKNIHKQSTHEDILGFNGLNLQPADTGLDGQAVADWMQFRGGPKFMGLNSDDEDHET